MLKLISFYLIFSLKSYVVINHIKIMPWFKIKVKQKHVFQMWKYFSIQSFVAVFTIFDWYHLALSIINISKDVQIVFIVIFVWVLVMTLFDKDNLTLKHHPVLKCLLFLSLLDTFPEFCILHISHFFPPSCYGLLYHIKIVEMCADMFFYDVT